MATAIHRMVEQCEAGTFPRSIARLRSGWLIAGESQVVRGYCLLLPCPVVDHLNGFPDHATQTQFLTDFARAGECLLRVTRADRINYEMLGNLEPALHCHLFPRYSTEQEEFRTKPIWFYDWPAARTFDQTDHAWVDELRSELKKDSLLA